MIWTYWSLAAFLAGLSDTFARPSAQQEKTPGYGAEGLPAPGKTYADPLAADMDTDPRLENVKGGSPGPLGAGKWKEALAEGNVRLVVDALQRALGGDRPARVRTQWGSPEHPNLGNAVRNTVDWKAFDSGKKSLDIIMDSKFTRGGGGAVNVVDPSLGVSFQIRY